MSVPTLPGVGELGNSALEVTELLIVIFTKPPAVEPILTEPAPILI